MSILKAIKDWWKPEVKEAAFKPRIAFKNGVVQRCYVRYNESFEVDRLINAYCSLNCRQNTLDNGGS